MLTFWFYLTLILAVFQWLSRWFNWKKVYILTKPGTLISLIIWSLQISGWRGGMIWFGFALVFSLAGDILLMLPPRYFLSGLAAFLTAHVLYIIGLNPGLPRFNLPIFLTAAVLLIFDFFWIRKFYSRLKKKAYSRLFRIPHYHLQSGDQSYAFFSCDHTLPSGMGTSGRYSDCLRCCAFYLLGYHTGL